MSWSDRYIGTPYAAFGRTMTGADCWGLACLIYRKELSINLPEYQGDYASVDEHAEISALITDGADSPFWVPVDGSGMGFDIAVFRRGRLNTHIGIVVRHGAMIHMQGEDCAKIESYVSGPWSHRFQGHFRYHSMTVKHPVEGRSGDAQ